MPTEDPLPNMTAQERKDWAQAKVTNRAAAERAPLNTGRGSVREVIDTQQQAAGRVRERTRERE